MCAKNQPKGMTLLNKPAFPALFDKGNTPACCRARSLIGAAINAAMAAVEPFRLVTRQISLDGKILRIKEHEVDLGNVSRLFVVGAGKAGLEMLRAVESVLGDHISGGLINVPEAGGFISERVVVNVAGHPVPDSAGEYGARKILEIVSAAEENDLVLCLISGGGSSLMPLPRAGITLDEKRRITTDLLRCGASITEINAVRKHISAIKGGNLAKAAFPARLINLILSDVIGDPLDVIASGPAVPDLSTFADAVAVLDKYQLLETTPDSIKQCLENGMNGKEPETAKPGERIFDRIENVIIGNNLAARSAAVKVFEAEGLSVMHIAVPFESSSVEAASRLLEILKLHETKRPLAVVAGGETTVRVSGSGRGGRAQELVLAMTCADMLPENAAFAAFATDGIDGPTDAAGAVADSFTVERALSAGMVPESYLANNDSYNFLKALDDLLVTGYTGSNVNDLYLAVML